MMMKVRTDLRLIVKMLSGSIWQWHLFVNEIFSFLKAWYLDQSAAAAANYINTKA
jgi:hypothetical protein